MYRPKIVITNRIHERAIDLLRERCEVVVNSDLEPWSCEQRLEEASEATGMIAFMSDCVDHHFLARCPKLRIVAGVLKGFDNFDVAACTDRGVWVTIVRNHLTTATAELTIGLMIAISRHIVESDAYLRRGYKGWRPVFYGLGLEHSVVGILGMGAIGQAVASRLGAFGCHIRYFDEDRRCQFQGASFTSLENLLSSSDFVVIALPLTADTRHLINVTTLRMMKQGAYLINTARGSIVDEGAVADALASGWLAGYAADVFEMEDCSRTNRPSSISPRLLTDRSSTVLTPHLGSAEHRVRQLAELEMAHSVLDYLAGRIPRGAVNNPLNHFSRAEC